MSFIIQNHVHDHPNPWITMTHYRSPTDLSVDEDVEEDQEDEGYDTVDKQVKVNEINLDV